MTSRRISHAELQPLLVANGVHPESPFAGIAASGRPFILDGVEYTTAPEPAIVSASDVPARVAGETDSAYALRGAAEIAARRASAAQPSTNPSTSAVQAPAPADRRDVGDQVAELLRARRDGRKPAAWATRPLVKDQPALTAESFTPREGETQTQFARRFLASCPAFETRS